MDNQYVAQAQAAYQARDFQAASQAYVQLLQDPSVPKARAIWGICTISWATACCS